MRSLPTIAVVAFLALVVTACDRSPVDIEDDNISVGGEPGDPEPTLPPPPQTRAITVMTRNLYLSADLTPVMGAASPEEIPGAVGEAWNRIVLNDFPARADAIAREIQGTRPDVIGLQEVAKFRIQSPGDFLVGNPQAATAVEYDYLTLLLDALQARGLRGILPNQGPSPYNLKSGGGRVLHQVGRAGESADPCRDRDHRQIARARPPAENPP